MPPRPPRRPGRVFATAATLVTAPRLVLAFLAGDGVEIPPAIRVALLTLSSVATAIAMTGGAAYLAHAIARCRQGRRVLTVLWFAVLLASSALMAPVLVVGLARSPLAAALGTAAARWAWSVCAVLAVDLVAAGAMRADAEPAAAPDSPDEREEIHQRAIAELLTQRDTARAALQAAQSALTPAPEPPPSAAPQPAPTAPPTLRCPCGRSGFATQHALAGHQRWCTDRTGRNDHSALAAVPVQPILAA